MPPRYAYWTILVDEQPTAFRAGAKEDLMPTFNRLKAKNDTAKMMWFQLGKLWPSRLDAQEFMRARGEMGRKGDERQAGRSSFGDRGGYRDRKPGGSFGDRKPAARSAWSPRGEPSTPPPARNADDKLDWKPKGEFVPAPKRADREDRPKSDWTPKARSEKPDWKPKASFDRKPSFDRDRKPSGPRKPWSAEKPDWKSKRSDDREQKPRSFSRPAFKPSGDDDRKSAKPEWKPKGSFTPEARRPAKSWDSEKPAWKSKPSGDRDSKPAWKSKPSFDRDSKPAWKSKPSGDRDRKPWSSDKPAWKPKGEFSPRARSPQARKPWDSDKPRSSSFKPREEKLDWKPKGEGASRPPRTDSGTGEKRKWVPKEEYKKSMGIEAKRDAKWRPGGLHKDPKQKYKDAKKAKWTKFKKNIRTKWEGKGKKKSDD